tara:strand:+ start:1931 stop:2434 length:504 start_codon:yes stop_codon:yes gene_type:complete
MPFTAPLLSVAAGSQFDCLIETTGTYANSSGSSAQFTNYMAGGAFNVISDTKSIVTQVFNTSTRDSVQLTTSGTLKITVLENYTYTSADSGNKFGLHMVGLAPDGDYTVSTTAYDHTLFSGGAQQTVVDETLDTGATRPGLVGSLFKSPAGGSFSTSGRLLIGINKT